MKNCLRSVAAALALCIAFGPGLARADTVTDLVNYYSFDNSTDPGHDDSGNLRDAAFVGASWASDAQRGGVASLAGGSNKLTAALPALDSAGVTVALWAQRIAGHAGSNEGLFVANDGSSNKTVGGWVNASDQVWGRIRAGGANSLPQDDDAKMPGDGLWTQLVFRGNGSSYQVFQDGVNTGNSVGYSAAIDQTTNLLTIGRQGTESWTGLIDDFRVYDRSLTDADVSQLYHATMFWNFDANDDDEAGSVTQDGWTDTDATNINNVTYAAVGAGVTVDDRERGTGNSTDAAHQHMWMDFIFANGSNAAGEGLDITVEGLLANSVYDVRLWAFDSSSGSSRTATWTGSGAGGTSAELTFAGSGTKPASLDDYVAEFTAQTDASGTLVLEGRHKSGSTHTVFVNGFQLTLVPEPTTLALAVVGLLGLRRRRR